MPGAAAFLVQETDDPHHGIIIGQQEIVIKTLGKLLSGLKMLAGATVLGDGHVAMILDVSALM